MDTDILLAIIGGTLISLSTTFHLLTKGRVTGMSGIFYGILTRDKKTLLWKSALIASMMMTSIMFFLKSKQEKYYAQKESRPQNLFFANSFDDNEKFKDTNFLGYLIAGLLVGFGTKIGNGCTSGHGVCGLPRLSKRSFVAVGCFMFTGVATATLRYNYKILSEEFLPFPTYDQALFSMFFSNLILLLSTMVIIVTLIKSYYTKQLTDVLVAIVTGILFSLGLLISGMGRRSKILSFLVIKEGWSPVLMFVLASAVGLNLITFNYFINIIRKPFLAENSELPTNTIIDRKLIIGSSIFGIGWAIGGVCPGPVFTLFPLFLTEITLFWMVGFAFGQYLAGKMEEGKLKKN